MRNGQYAIFLAAALAAGTTAALCAPTPVRLSLDNPTEVRGIETVCTGVGETSRADPRWNAYPLKVEIAGKDGQYLGDVTLAVSKGDNEVVNVNCAGPWALFKLASAQYKIDATIGTRTVTAMADVPASGQGRIVLRFPDTGGAVAPGPTD